ncbi:sugar porter family MFS transporter [Cellulomonas sp. DKR-3]|uniref:Sugar porter family MFS transporter n=1 Tax=Cellulomonas fulva TaxID=2835530 RepID=A0ABS5TYA5_9CELL|nr:sugar porter family MFS transporter [Cellulomonas fulva]MBT0994129.1 sugar porter family MFS transporter [Cellulomonas fulva]
MSAASPAGEPSTAPGIPRSLRNKAIALSVAAAVGGFLFGFDSSVINGAVDAINQEFDLVDNDILSGFVVAVALLGCALGAWIAGRLADRWGRTRTMVLGSVMFLVSSVMTGLAFSVGDLILWRVLSGIGIGIASVMAPAYIAEISPAALRGRLGSLQQLAITLGIFAALLSDQLLQDAAGGPEEELWLGFAAWQWMFFVGVVPAAVYGILALAMPESPRYLLLKSRHDEARRVLASVDPDPDDAVRRIENAIEEDQRNAQQGSLKGPVLGLLPIVWVGILLSVFQQFVGINVIFYYSTTLWQAVGFDQDDSFMVSTITSITNVVVTLIAIALVDKVGRRPMLLVGSLGMTVSLGLMALAFTQSFEVPDPEKAGEMMTMLPDGWGTTALIAANAFVVFFGATWGPLVWVLLGEMFPNRIRAAALGVAAAAQWIANFVITETFPILLGAFGASIPYLMYTIFAFISFWFVLAKVPETKGRALEDMNDLKVERGRRPAPTT